MTYKLFLDDERYPVADDWVIARTSNEAIDLLKMHGVPQEIAFDHDLGGSDTAMVYIRTLIDHMIDTGDAFPEGFKFSVHSQNPVGAENIRSLMNGFIASCSN